MRLEILQSDKALEDIIKEAHYLAKSGSLNLSDRFLGATKEAFVQLAEMPGLGVLVDYGNPSFHGMRKWSIPGFRKYLVFYLVTEIGLVILRVLHGSRDIDTVFSPDSQQ